MDTIPPRQSILCIYNIAEHSLLDLNPQDIFEGMNYRVETVHAYTHGLSLIESCHFDYVLTDLNLPRIDKAGVARTPYGNQFFNYLDSRHTKGFGLFVPSELSEMSFRKNEQSYITHVASNGCWTPCGNHDWIKLFQKILYQQEVNPYTDQHQEQCIPGNS